MPESIGNACQPVEGVVGVSCRVPIPVRQGRAVVIGIVGVGLAVAQRVCHLGHAAANVILVLGRVPVLIRDLEDIPNIVVVCGDRAAQRVGCLDQAVEAVILILG